MVPETRELRFLVAVAETGGFSAAASRLGLAQQSVSAAVRQLERRVGVPLLERHGRGVRLTAAGEALAEGAVEVLALAEKVVRRSRRRAGLGVLRIGYAVLAAADLVAPLLAELQLRRPDLRVELHLAEYDDPSAGLVGGEVDLALLRRPVAGDLAFADLYSEARVAALPSGHPAAGATTVGIEELRGEPIVADPGPDDGWRRFWTGVDLPGADPGPEVEVGSFEEELSVVALGRAVALTSEAAARLYPRPGVAYVPLRDPVGCTVAVAWSPARRPEALDAVLACARRVLDR